GGSLSGPLVPDRLALLLAGRLTQSRRLERGDPTVLHSDFGSGLAQLVATPDAANEVRLLAAFQGAMRAFEGPARPGRRGVREDDRYLHLQAAWSRRGASSWTLAAGYQRGSFTPDAPPEPAVVHTIDRIFDGPVGELALAGRRHDERWDVEAHASPDLSGLLGRRHALRVGGSFSHAVSVARPLADSGLTAESVAGLPPRLC